MINPLEEIKIKISQEFTGIFIDFDPAENETDSSWLDIFSEDKNFTIEYKPSQGFGLYLGQVKTYGEGPNEIYRNKDILIKRLSMILKDNKEEISLKEIRELLGITQEDIARLLGQQQPSISKLEKREDLMLKSIFRYINAIGGNVKINISIEGCDIPLNFPEFKHA